MDLRRRGIAGGHESRPEDDVDGGGGGSGCVYAPGVSQLAAAAQAQRARTSLPVRSPQATLACFVPHSYSHSIPTWGSEPDGIRGMPELLLYSALHALPKATESSDTTTTAPTVVYPPFQRDRSRMLGRTGNREHHFGLRSKLQSPLVDRSMCSCQDARK